MPAVAEKTENIRYAYLAYVHLGEIYFLTGKRKEALDLYTDMGRTIKETRERTMALIRAGEVHVYSSSWDAGGDLLSKAGTLCKRFGYMDGYAEVCILEAWFYRAKANYGKALERAFEADAILHKESFRARERARLKLKLFNTLGVICWERCEYKKAIKYYKDGIAIAKKLKNLKAIGALSVNLGIIYYDTGHFEDALKLAESQIEISVKTGVVLNEALAHQSAGTALYALKRCDEALKHHEISRSLFKKFGTKKDYLPSYCNIGAVYQEKGLFEKALHYYREYMSNARELGERRSEALASCNIGYCLMSLKRFEEAEGYFLDYLRLSEEIGHRYGIMKANYYLAYVHGTVNDFKRALVFLKKAFSLAKEIGSNQTISEIEVLAREYPQYYGELLR